MIIDWLELRNVVRLVLCGVLVVVLSACGGGGGSRPEPPPTPPPSPPKPPTVVNPAPGTGGQGSQTETENSNFLPLINAGQRYAGSDGGAGITVAVIDDGVNFSHFDLFGSQFAYRESNNPAEHGTPVAGTIAARRNGTGMHGVAYNAHLISLANCFASNNVDLSRCSQTEERLGQDAVLASDIASAAGLSRTYGNAVSNPEASSHIMNMSWGPTLRRVTIGTSRHILSAMRDAAAAGRIMVAALGNSRLPGPEGGPASVVGDSRIAGFGIAVGALNSAGTAAASFSNRCGTSAVARYCLFAPGDRVESAHRGGGWGRFSGTSFASPIVAGAAAVVWGAFPNKFGNEIVARLLDTADKSGVFGISSIYGRGRLDLEAALNPVGVTSLRFEGGGTAPVLSSTIDLPSGFRAPSGVAGLSSVVAYDEQDFPFLYDLNASFQDSQSTATDGALEGFLTSLGGTRSYVPIGKSVAFEFTAHEEDFLRRDLASSGSARNSDIRSFEVHFQLQPTVSLSLGHHVNYSGASNRALLDHTARTVLPAGSTVAPFTAFAERDALAWSLAWQSNEHTTVDLVGQVGKDRLGYGDTRLASVGLTRRFAGDWTVGTQAGVLQEEQTLLGIRSEGGFAGLSDTDTHFMDVSLSGPVTPNVILFTSLSSGWTNGRRVDGGASLVSGWEDVTTGSFLLGGEWTDPGIAGSDRIVLTVASPFHARNAQLRLRVPSEEVADQDLRYTAETVDLAPSGRETRVQFVYETDWTGGDEGGSSFALGGYVRLEPDHDAKADADYGLAVKYAVQF